MSKDYLVPKADLGMQVSSTGYHIKFRYFLYECPSCGKDFESRLKKITKCVTCIKTKHNLSRHRLYHRWLLMWDRCNNPKSNNYLRYGGRGIKVAKEFEDVHTYITYIEALDNAYRKGYSIDRVNNDKNYMKGNLRWASKETQGGNTRRLISTNTSGYRGVTQVAGKDVWRSYITVKGKRANLGHHKTKLKAAKAYDKYVTDNDLPHTTNGVYPPKEKVDGKP